jgi:chromate transporter
MILQLFSRFGLISLLAFGGGGAALPLVERLAVNETGWIAPQDFAAAVAFGYLTPGPVLITATFVGCWPERCRERDGGDLLDALALGGGGGAATATLHATPAAGGFRSWGCPGGGGAPWRDCFEYREAELHTLGLCSHRAGSFGPSAAHEPAPHSDPYRQRGPGMGYRRLH